MNIMKNLKMTVHFTPKPKASVRLSARGILDPSARGMKVIRDYATEYARENKIVPLKGPLLVVCHFNLPLPTGARIKQRIDENLCPHYRKPDADNLEKFLNDCLSGVLWDDDCQISWILRSKSKTSRKDGFTVIYVEEIPDAPVNYDAIMQSINEHIRMEEI